MQWFRWWTGTCSDPKFALIAQRARQPKAVVLAVWAAILEAACTEEDEGRFSTSPEELALTLDLDVNVIKTTIKELRARKLLTRNRIAAWNKRQFPSDNSTPRTRKHRMNMRKKERSGNVSGTSQRTRVKRSGNAPETEAETETETEAEGLELTPEVNPPADSPPTSDSPTRPLQQSDSDWYRYNRVACGPLLEALREAAPTLHRSTTKCARWCRALFDAAEEPDNAWGLQEWAEALRRDPPSSSVYPDRWIEQQKREQATGPPSPRDVYADPQGTSFGPHIDRYGQRWREWIEAAGDEEERVRRRAAWGEAIRAAEAEDYAALEAGP